MTNDSRIAKVQKTLRWFEADIPRLDMRVKELSKERQESARQFAAALIDQTRAELERLLQERPVEVRDPGEMPCEPAD
jgi:peptidoglycan hydrolase CwlO-like protein